MKKHIFSLALLLTIPACFKKKSIEKAVIQTQPSNTKKIGHAKFDEDAQEFYLEDDENGNVFQNCQNAKAPSELDLIEMEIEEEAQNKRCNVIQFDFDDTRVKADQKPLVKENAENLKSSIKNNKNAVAVAHGHACQFTKSESYNHAISQERAEQVKKELINNGVSADKVKAVGHGSAQPIIQTSESAREMRKRRESAIKELAPNRRVETKVIKS